jgi:segregation and condensation protein B
VELDQLKAVVESLLFAAGEPVSLGRLAAALDDVPREELRRALTELGADCNREGRGVVLVEVAGGYQLRTAREHAGYVRRLLAARPPRLSRPILETLAIIAYRQPITRPEIEQLRGVDSGAVLETLLERSLVRIAGRKEAPGRPQLYATTADFLETFGLKDLDALPDLSELREVEEQIENAGALHAAEAAQSGEQLSLAIEETSPEEGGVAEITEPAPSATEGEQPQLAPAPIQAPSEGDDEPPGTGETPLPAAPPSDRMEGPEHPESTSALPEAYAPEPGAPSEAQTDRGPSGEPAIQRERESDIDSPPADARENGPRSLDDDAEPED